MYLDDFGTGYSSLSSLQRYPVDALKLDRSFVARMGTPDHGCAIGNAIVKLAHELGMGLIAEGVETLAHAEQLLALGCPHAQGHLFSEPRTTEAPRRCWRAPSSACRATWRATRRARLQPRPDGAEARPYSFRSLTRRTAWSRPFSRITCARSRVGSTFSRRFTALIVAQMSRAVAAASSGDSDA